MGKNTAQIVKSEQICFYEPTEITDLQKKEDIE